MARARACPKRRVFLGVSWNLAPARLHLDTCALQFFCPRRISSPSVAGRCLGGTSNIDAPMTVLAPSEDRHAISFLNPRLPYQYRPRGLGHVAVVLLCGRSNGPVEFARGRCGRYVRLLARSPPAEQDAP
eukprot:15247169-Alexandrium_andersonii.AAC.1